MWRRLTATLVVGVAVAGCNDQSPSTRLTLVATNPSVGRATFTLECEPAGGDVPRPAAACASLARDPAVLLHPKRFVCAGGTFSWWRIVITGQFDDEPVDVRTDTCWTPQMDLIRALGIGGEIQRHVEPLSRPAYPGSGIPRWALADVVEIPETTPAWLLRIARLAAREAGDPRPDRLTVESRNAYVITLEGDFVCSRCTRRAGAEPPRGSRLRISVGKSTRAVDSVLLDDGP